MIVGDFRKQLEEEIKSYQFNIILPEESRKNYDIEVLNTSQAKVKLEEIVDELAEQALDLVLVFLSGSKNDENTENDDLYTSVKRFLLRRDIASQVVYTNTLSKPENYRNILNNIVSGILAKLGNLPFVLAEPLAIAEAFVGLDVSRFSYQNRSGSRNVCASVRFYGRQGDFIRYRLESDLIEGEEIPRQALENFFPSIHFKNKVVLVYRDGRFQGDEAKHLLARANAINAKFILVESVKSRVPRLYNLNNGNLSQPTRGLGLKLSEREVILVTTSVPENIGVPRPVRLRIHEDGEQASLEQLIDATLKLTLLHHGSLKDPRLPIPLYGSDAIAYRRLQGIYPTNSEGDRQFWL
jgi:argonaute-like protein implicated in RNA metabolism and viral defense